KNKESAARGFLAADSLFLDLITTSFFGGVE
ncbi:MAG: hypothetical protein PWP62_2152, partial [Eubacteriaceae bacterium]|nr:hypothetical protein [Eubacteriaceae bacterium]